MYDFLLLGFEPIIVGSVGAALILVAFVMGQFHFWKDTYFIYDLMNLLGSLMLIVYALIGFSWPFVILNGVWALVSLKDCVTDLTRNTRRKSNLGPWEKWMK